MNFGANNCCCGSRGLSSTNFGGQMSFGQSQMGATLAGLPLCQNLMGSNVGSAQLGAQFGSQFGQIGSGLGNVLGGTAQCFGNASSSIGQSYQFSGTLNSQAGAFPATITGNEGYSASADCLPPSAGFSSLGSLQGYGAQYSNQYSGNLNGNYSFNRAQQFNC